MGRSNPVGIVMVTPRARKGAAYHSMGVAGWKGRSGSAPKCPRMMTSVGRKVELRREGGFSLAFCFD